jgi:hypothetical protein
VISVRVAALLAVVLLSLAPSSVRAADATLAPADESFGRMHLSVLGIANTIRDAGRRIAAGADPQAIVDGALAFANDALHAWEARYPHDPWIARDLLALSDAYRTTHVATAERLAADTLAWLVADFPSSAEAARAHLALGGGAPTAPVAPLVQSAQLPVPANASVPSAGTAWDRFTALRAASPSR